MWKIKIRNAILAGILCGAGGPAHAEQALAPTQEEKDPQKPGFWLKQYKVPQYERAVVLQLAVVGVEKARKKIKALMAEAGAMEVGKDGAATVITARQLQKGDYWSAEMAGAEKLEKALLRFGEVLKFEKSSEDTERFKAQEEELKLKENLLLEDRNRLGQALGGMPGTNALLSAQFATIARLLSAHREFRGRVLIGVEVVEKQ